MNAISNVAVSLRQESSSSAVAAHCCLGLGITLPAPPLARAMAFSLFHSPTEIFIEVSAA